jgi:hypothetical protein
MSAGSDPMTVENACEASLGAPSIGFTAPFTDASSERNFPAPAE